jgi:molybdenum cofactor biosynthesis protein B
MEHEHKAHAPKHLRFAVITISDSRTKENDDSGKLIMGFLKETGHEIVHHEIVKDDFNSIKRTITELARDVDVVIANGGTGISRKDVTPESVGSLLSKELNGFGELFRMLSYQDIGSAAMMSRALAGTFGNKIIICLPGSPKAVELAMKKLILPEIGHMIWEARR